MKPGRPQGFALIGADVRARATARVAPTIYEGALRANSPGKAKFGFTSNQSGSRQPGRQFHLLPYPARSDRHRLYELAPAVHRGGTLQVRNHRTRVRTFPK